MMRHRTLDPLDREVERRGITLEGMDNVLELLSNSPRDASWFIALTSVKISQSNADFRVPRDVASSRRIKSSMEVRWPAEAQERSALNLKHPTARREIDALGDDFLNHWGRNHMRCFASEVPQEYRNDI